MFFNHSNSFTLEGADQTKLFLTWLFYQNFKEFEKEENLTLLNQAWQNMKHNLQKYYDNYSTTLEMIAKAFKKITVTTDPKIALRYNSFSNTLFSNIIELFFSQADIGKSHFVCTISWKLASQLIHEFDHYKLFRDNNLIGKESKIKQFGQREGMKFEKSAIDRQKEFLEHCRKNLPSFTCNPLIRISTWTAEGRPILDERSSYRHISKDEMDKGITNFISILRSNLVRNLKQYQINSQKNNANQNRILRKSLALHYKDNSRKSYSEIELLF